MGAAFAKLQWGMSLVVVKLDLDLAARWVVEWEIELDLDWVVMWVVEWEIELDLDLAVMWVVEWAIQYSELD